ncbi:hypothetical protein SAMN05443428_10360 [Caloramator quimbayensis]|uniref:Uncharacterized protein n=1 Tax=Caloramator quimbayensis TaxID=1147123 RepID=A0A1T4WPX4_9CLOT|nr:clostripain-related cysteine peptidase [Caloramator quimbayensis]SKA79422.1 hypothetical protein SAMN05443428_10360 [Caloramator quimbayensis]
MKKRWSVLFYLNGNNEIEPEIFNSFKRILEIKNDDVDIYIEIGRIKKEIIKKIRVRENIDLSNDDSFGVSRYIVKSGEVKHTCNLGNKNMADPKQLYDFISWAINFGNSENMCLIIAAHGFSFIGGITDFSLDYPYVMPIEDMCYVINKALYDNKKELNLLVLDMCYMNYIEIINELYKRHSIIKYILTYDEEGDFKGLNYKNFIESLSYYNEYNPIEFFNKFNNENIILIKSNRVKMKDIKNFCDYFAKQMINVGYSISNINTDILIEVYDKINEVIMYKKSSNQSVKIVDFYLDRLSEYYCNLSFSQNNKWFNLISGSKKIYINKQNINLMPRKLTKTEILGLVLTLNPGIDINKAIKIIDDIMI